MAFLPIQYESGKLTRIEMEAITFNKGEAVIENGTAGYFTKAGAGTGSQVEYVMMETISTAATQGDRHLAIRTQGVVFKADTDADTIRTAVGTYCDLATVATLDQDATSDDQFYIERNFGAAADRKCIGRFAEGAPNV